MTREEMHAIRDHLWSHMTDGRWHDDCRWCLARRSEGGTGVGAETRLEYETVRAAWLAEIAVAQSQLMLDRFGVVSSPATESETT